MTDNFEFVNWSDGMKISSKHFKDLENVLMNNVVAHSRVSTNFYSYGLLQPQGEYNNSLSFNLKQHSQDHVTISLDHCFGITPGGLVLYIDHQLGSTLYQDKKVHIQQAANESSYYLVLGVSMMKRTPSGAIDNDEKPIRHQNAYFEVNFSLISESELDASSQFDNYLVLQKYQLEGENFVAEDDYVVPAASIQSTETMRLYYNDTLEFFGDLDRFAIEIVKKSSERSSSLASNIGELAMEVAKHLSTLNFGLNNIIYEKPPIYLMQYYADLASRFRLFFKLIEPSEKEELLNYFEEWTQINPGQFQDAIKGVLGMQYQHINLGLAMKDTRRFRDVIYQVFEELSKLDFIGKRKQDLGIVYEKKKNQKGIFSPIKRK